jgi:hypothetical protein
VDKTVRISKSGVKKLDEAERIYRAIFRTPIPAPLKDRYDMALPILFTGSSPEENRAVERALNCVSDLEALEFAARHQKKLPQLVYRFQLMVHLAESIPANQSVFVQSRDNKIRAYFSLLWGGLRTLYKFVKGWCLLRRVGDA